MNCKYHQIADTLCKLTEEVLWNSDSFSELIAFNHFKLKTRIGCGMATYCKFNPKEKLFTITYGRKMIESKFNQQQAKRWMSYREIASRRYYDQNTSLINVLAHTVCHEFAHVIQQINAPIVKGSIHNASFYSILDKIHLTDDVTTLRNKIEYHFSSNSLSPEYNNDVILTDIKETINVSIGMPVTFLHKKKTYSGKIIKINKKTVHVEVKKLLMISIWKVSKLCIKTS